MGNFKLLCGRSKKMTWDKKAQANWYQKNKDRLNKKRREQYKSSEVYRAQKINKALYYRAEINEWLRSYKLEKGCENCGFNKHHVALEFHHLLKKDKEFSIGGKIMAKIKIENELKKCIVLCSNCHKIHHYQEGWLK